MERRQLARYVDRFITQPVVSRLVACVAIAILCCLTMSPVGIGANAPVKAVAGFGMGEALLRDQSRNGVATETLRVFGGSFIRYPDSSLAVSISNEQAARAVFDLAETNDLRSLSWTHCDIDGQLLAAILSRFPRLQSATLDESTLDDNGLSSLMECKELQQLSMVACSMRRESVPLVDADFDSLRSAGTLEILDLRITGVEGAFLKKCQSLHTLRVGPRVGEAGTEAISTLRNLRELRIGFDMENWIVFRKLADLQELESFTIDRLPKADGPEVAAVFDENLSYLLASLPNLRKVRGSFFAPLLGDDVAAVLSKDKHLEVIEDRECRITDRGLQSLGRCPKLRRLALEWGNPWAAPTPIAFTPEGLAVLEKLDTLEELSLRDANLNDDYLQAISLFQSLRRVELGAGRVSTEGVRFLGGLKNLETLALHELNWIASGTENPLPVDHLDLGNLPKLKKLDLSESYFRGRVFDNLKSLPALRVLDLTACRLDDDAWDSLCSLPQVEVLVLHVLRPELWEESGLPDLASMPALKVILFDQQVRIKDEVWRGLRESKSLEMVVGGTLQTTLPHGRVAPFGSKRPQFVPASN